MHPKHFLQVCGILLLLLTVLGFLRPDFAGDFLSFDPGENLFHLIVGIAMVCFAQLPASPRRWVSSLVGLLLLALGIVGFLVAGKEEPNMFGLMHFEYPASDVLHGILGLWGIGAAIRNKEPKDA
jgi:uncharacterized membrane protein HdeD (DUF308 family)